MRRYVFDTIARPLLGSGECQFNKLRTNPLSGGITSCAEKLNRRTVFIGLGASLVSRVAIAASVPRIGILGDTPGRQWEAFRKAMADLGYAEGSTVEFESRFSHGIS